MSHSSAMNDRFLMPLEGDVKRKPFLVLDIETKKDDSQEAGFTRPFLAGIYDGVSFEAFRGGPTESDWELAPYEPGGCIDRMMVRLLRKQYLCHHIYAHNAGRFDFLFLVPWLQRYGRDLGFGYEVVPMQSAILILDVWRARKDGKKPRKKLWRFLDSLRLMPSSLRSLGQSFGFVAKGEGKLDQDLNAHEDDPSWEVYLKRDCTLLYNVVSRFHDLVEHTLGGEVGVTAPATSMKTFRRRYQQRPLMRCKGAVTREAPEGVVHTFVRRGYYGGRVEPFRAAGERLRYYDINSSYPRAMMDPMPCGNAVMWEGPPSPRFLDENWVGFVECDVHLPPQMGEMPPPLPHRMTLGGPDEKLCFPVGKLRGVWDWAELQLVEAYGGEIVRYGQSVWFEARPIFREMVTDLYQYRDASRVEYDPALAQVVKILLNSLYGKFGMKPERRKIYIAGCEEIPEGATPANPTDPDCSVWYMNESTDKPYIMPQIAAHVTALARIRLYEYMRRAVDTGGRLYYCDTDSILTDAVLPSSTALGELKDEYPGKVFKGKFLSPKVYALEDEEGNRKVKAKGMQSITYEKLMELAAGGSYEYETLEKVGSLARVSFGRGPRITKVKKTLRKTTPKRITFSSGETTPLIVTEW